MSLSSPGQHGAEAQLRQERQDSSNIPVQMNPEGQEVFVKVCSNTPVFPSGTASPVSLSFNRSSNSTQGAVQDCLSLHTNPHPARTLPPALLLAPSPPPLPAPTHKQQGVGMSMWQSSGDKDSNWSHLLKR